MSRFIRIIRYLFNWRRECTISIEIWIPWINQFTLIESTFFFFVRIRFSFPLHHFHLPKSHLKRSQSHFNYNSHDLFIIILTITFKKQLKSQKTNTRPETDQNWYHPLDFCFYSVEQEEVLKRKKVSLKNVQFYLIGNSFWTRQTC